MTTEEEIKYSIKVLKKILSCLIKNSEEAILVKKTISNLQTNQLNYNSKYVVCVIKELMKKKHINKNSALGKLVEEAIFYLETEPYDVK